MFKIGLLCILVSLLAVACGGEVDEKKEGNKIQLEKKTRLPSVDGSPFLVKSTPSDMKRMNANFDNKAILLGYSINTDTAAPGQVLMVTWFWKSIKPIEGTWEYFTHLMDEDGILVQSVNSQGAMRSKYKPQMWKPGEILKDQERIVIPQEWESKSMELRTGLWQGPQRLKVVKGPVDEENRARGPVVTISANAPRPIARSSASVEIPFTEKAPKIDGKLDDQQWSKAKILNPFVETLNGRPVRNRTDVKLLWDNTNLYVAMTAEDSELLSPYTNPDENLWKADAFDLFLEAQENGPYYELQISPNGIIYDAIYREYRKPIDSWSSNATLAVSLNGTVNDAADPADTGWSLEVAIPLAEILPGDLVNRTLKGNFYRIDKTAEGTEYSSWSAPMRGDFHAQDRFGQLVLTK